MYVEDRTSYNGPVQVNVKPTFTLAELKAQIQCEFEIPVDVQRWILGKSLAEDDQSTLESHGINKSGQNIYLYLVAPKENEGVENKPKTEDATSDGASKSVPENKVPTQEVPEGLPRKGRYWNYEMDRWSYCSSSEDEDENNQIKVLDKPPQASNTPHVSFL